MMQSIENGARVFAIDVRLRHIIALTLKICRGAREHTPLQLNSKETTVAMFVALTVVLLRSAIFLRRER